MPRAASGGAEIALARCPFYKTNLHRHEPVVNHNLLGKAERMAACLGLALMGSFGGVREEGSSLQVGANRGLVLVAEALVDILVHERGLADTDSDETKPREDGEETGRGKVTQEGSREAGERGAGSEGGHQRPRDPRSAEQHVALRCYSSERLSLDAPAVAKDDDLKWKERGGVGRAWSSVTTREAEWAGARWPHPSASTADEYKSTIRTLRRTFLRDAMLRPVEWV